MSDDNYPDDIHSYDNDPRSPFYVEPVLVSDCCQALWDEPEEDVCPKCGEECNWETPEEPEPPERERWEDED